MVMLMSAMMEPFHIRAVSEVHAVLMEVRRGHYIAINIDEFRLIGLPVRVSFLSYTRKILIRWDVWEEVIRGREGAYRGCTGLYASLYPLFYAKI